MTFQSAIPVHAYIHLSGALTASESVNRITSGVKFIFALNDKSVLQTYIFFERILEREI